MCNQASALHCCMHNSKSTNQFPAYLSVSENLSWNLKLATSSRKTLKTIFQTLQGPTVCASSTWKNMGPDFHRETLVHPRFACLQHQVFFPGLQRASRLATPVLASPLGTPIEQDQQGNVLQSLRVCLRKWHPHALWLILGYSFHSWVIKHNLKHNPSASLPGQVGSPDFLGKT